MDSSKVGLLTTLVLGIFILIGALIGFVVNKKEKVVDFSIGLAFGVIVMLIGVDLLPEIIEHLGFRYIHMFIIGTVIGFILLRFLDMYIPDHEEQTRSKKDVQNNLIHIGVITSMALILHNIIEGMAIYSTIVTNTSLGVTLMIGIGFHNIPLGMVVSSAFHQSNQNIYKTSLIIIVLALSTFVGGLIMFFFNITAISSVVLGTLLSVTLGMLIFIVYEELYERIKHSKNKKISYIGVFIGLLILVISTLI